MNLDYYKEAVDNKLSKEEKFENIKNKVSNGKMLDLSEADLVGFEDKDFSKIYNMIYGKDHFEFIVEDGKCGEIFNKSLDALLRYRVMNQTKKEFIEILTNNLVILFRDFLLYFDEEIWRRKNGNIYFVVENITRKDLQNFLQKLIFIPNVFPLTNREQITLINSIIDTISDKVLIEKENVVVESEMNITGSIGMYFIANNIKKEDLLDFETKEAYDKYVEYCKENGFEENTINAFNKAVREKFNLEITRIRKNYERFYVWGEK